MASALRQASFLYIQRYSERCFCLECDAMGRGNSGALNMGKLDRVPSETDIKMGTAKFGGIPVYYSNERDNEADNHYNYINVHDKFFQLDEEARRTILTHEVAHTYADDMIAQNAARSEFMRAFITQKPVPVGSAAYERGQRTYMEGLYGDIGSTALVETTTRAIVEYTQSPETLMQRSPAAYREIRRFLRSYGRLKG